MHRRVRSLLGLALFGLAASSWPALAETRGVVELFTSQGCSSCPAADRIIGELANDPSVVAVSLPIDYWDYLGWKDTLASPNNSARQRAYARKRGDREIYTPQVVVNGKVHVPGGDEAALMRAMANTRGDSDTLSVSVELAADRDQVAVVVPSGSTRVGGEVWLCELSGTVPVTIERGENSGRTVTYHNVLRRRVKLGTWNGELRRFNIPLTELSSGVDTVAVMLQAGTADDPGAMLGAAIEHLHPSQARVSSGR